LAPRNRLLTLFRDCKGLIGTNDEQAEAMLADIVGILNAGPGEGRTPTTSPNAKSDLLARLNALGSRIKEFAAAADAAGKEAGADLEAKKAALAPRNRLLTLFRDCKGLIGTNDGQAEAMLAEIEGILTTGPGKGRTPTSGPAVQTAASTGNDDPSPAKTPELQARLKSLLLRQKAIFEKDPGQRKALMPFSQPATSLAPTGQPGATEALDKLESAIAAIETQLAAKGGTAEATEKKDEQEPPAEPPKPATFEDRIAEVEAAIGRLKPDNPFVADLRSRLQFLQGNRPQEDDTRGWEITNQNLSVLQERAAEALPFERKLELVQSLMEKVQGDPRLGNLATELLERVNGVLTFARQQMPELGSRIAQSMAELATLEQKARSGLPADVVKNLDELLALQARADEVWDKIETVGDDDVRGKLLDQYRQLTGKIPSSDNLTSENLAEAKELLATLEQQLKDALAAAPASPAGDAPQAASTTEPPPGSSVPPATPEPGLEAEWKKKEAAWSPAIKTAIQAKGPNSAKILELLTEANSLTKAPTADLAQALAKLTECYGLARSGTNESGPTPRPSSGPQSEESPRGRISPRVAFMQAQIEWRKAASQVRTQLDQLRNAILEAAEGESDEVLSDLEGKTMQLYKILGTYADELLEKLDAKLEAANPEDQSAAIAEAATVVKKYQQFVDGNSLVTDIESNPFNVKIKVKDVLSQTLSKIDSLLAS